MTEYHLYPPFFIVPEEQNFADAWEAFCCKMVNLQEKRADIYRRSPPEYGVDLYGNDTATAYQCKSVESGLSSGFNAAKAIKSISSALAIRPTLPWKKYVVCTNVDVTGTAEEKLREVLSDVELRPKSYWTTACESHPDAAEPHFRRLVSIPRPRTEDALREGFVEQYSRQLRDQLEKGQVNVYLYSNRHDKVYRLPVSLDFKVDDLIHVFRMFFRLPREHTYEDAGISISLSHSLVLNGKKQTFGKTLRECGVEEHSILTYWTTMVWQELDAEAKATVANRMHMVVGMSANPRASAMEDYKRLVSAAFGRFDASLAPP